jgi:predicted phosphodiesterase
MFRNKSGKSGLFILVVILGILLCSLLVIRGDIQLYQTDDDDTTTPPIDPIPDDDDSEIFDDDNDGDSGSDGSSSGGGGDDTYFGDTADLIHLVLGDNPESEIKIIWVTGADGVNNNTVLYHKDGAGANSTAVGTATNLPDTTDYVHIVEITGLDSESIYHFWCSGVEVYSSERLFRTTGTILSNFTVITDTQGLSDEFENVSIEMVNENPEFVLHCGDHVSSSDDMDEWIEYFEIIEETWVTDGGISLAQAPVLGNHDDSSEWFWIFFDLTDDQEWKSYDWDNWILTTLNSVDDDLVDNQNAFLEAAISVDKNQTVAFHHNIWESPIKSEQDEIVDNWVPLFEEYNVTSVVHGHEHRYYRSDVTNNVTYYCAGAGGGSPRDAVGPDALSIAAYDDRYCYMLFDIAGNTVNATDIDGAVFDTHTIY